MRSNLHQKVHFLRLASSSKEEAPSMEGLKKAASMGLIRVAGNVFECPSTQDFWKIKGDKVIRLSGIEVDNNESLPPADVNNPSSYLREILADLDF